MFQSLKKSFRPTTLVFILWVLNCSLLWWSYSLSKPCHSSCWLPTAARVRSQVSLCDICGEQNDSEADFLRVFRIPLPIFIHQLLHNHILGLYQHNHLDSIGSLLDLGFINSVDISTNLAQTDSYYPRFLCDFTQKLWTIFLIFQFNILWRICSQKEMLSHRNLKTRTQQ
jgi:hypothetical protein